MTEYGMNEFEMIKKADVMRIINAENAAVLNNLQERSTDEVLCAIASQINDLQTTAKSGGRLIFTERLKLTLKINDYIAEHVIIMDTFGIEVIDVLSSLGLLDVEACKKYLSERGVNEDATD